MKLNYRIGAEEDIPSFIDLALKSWKQFELVLTPENWYELYSKITNSATFQELLSVSHAIVCENDHKKMLGMAYLVSSGNPTDIYQADWSYIRFVSVDPVARGHGIGRALTVRCLDLAREQREHYVALHTSEMMKPAMKLYESLGFEVQYELPKRLGKRYWLYMLKI